MRVAANVVSELLHMYGNRSFKTESKLGNGVHQHKFNFEMKTNFLFIIMDALISSSQFSSPCTRGELTQFCKEEAVTR